MPIPGNSAKVKPNPKTAVMNLSVEEENLAAIPFAVLERRVGKRVGKIEINGAKTLADVDSVQVRYLGRSGLLTELIKNLKNLPPEEKPNFGKVLNETKVKLEAAVKEKKQLFQERNTEQKLKAEIRTTDYGLLTTGKRGSLPNFTGYQSKAET